MSTFVYLHVLCTKKVFSYLFTCLRRDIQSLEVSITQHLASPFLSAYLSLFICSSLMSAYLWILFFSRIFPSSNIILVNDNSVNTENFPQVRNLCLMVVTKKRLSFTRWLGIQYFLHLLHWIICFHSLPHFTDSLGHNHLKQMGHAWRRGILSMHCKTHRWFSYANSHASRGIT